MEVRSFGAEAAPALKDGRIIEGYAIVFNRESRLMYNDDKKSYFIEYIRPEAVTPAFLAEQDIKLTRNHNNDLLLARSLGGNGSLSYVVDEYGVKYTAEVPNTTTGNDTLELIKRGDLFGSSFAFSVEKGGYKDTKVGNIWMREITAFTGIYDFSVVTDPAYYATSVTSRSFDVEQVKSPDVAEIEQRNLEYETARKQIENILTQIQNF